MVFLCLSPSALARRWLVKNAFQDYKPSALTFHLITMSRSKHSHKMSGGASHLKTPSGSPQQQIPSSIHLFVGCHLSRLRIVSTMTSTPHS
jgi:hypothetical protein